MHMSLDPTFLFYYSSLNSSYTSCGHISADFIITLNWQDGLRHHDFDSLLSSKSPKFSQSLR